MKRVRFFFSAILMLILLVSALPAQAAEHYDEPYYITAYDVNIYVQEDNVLSITENIDVYFNEERHGIYRNIPKENRVERADGSIDYTKAKIRNIRCSDDFEKSSSNTQISLQIGDPDYTITGRKHYTISYDYHLGQDVGDGFDELYYNIIGDGWDTYIDNVSFTITMPKEFDPDAVGFSAGEYGFAGTDSILFSVNGTEITGYLTQELAPYEACTIRIELEEGYFYFNQALHILKVCAIALLPVLALLVVFIIWLKFGKDEKVIETVEFYPPEGMNSADVAFWYKGGLPKKDLVALLIELANEGYVAIREGEKTGISRKTGYEIERIKEYPSNGDPNKFTFFQGLFESGKDIITGSDLEQKFYRTLDNIVSSYSNAGEEKRVYSLQSTRMKALCWLIVIAALVASYFVFYNTFGGNERFIAFGIGVVISLGSLWLARYVLKRTGDSHERLEKITGFKKFLETAEKDKLEMLVNDDPKYFYNILPYAYVLGISDKWVDKFENIAIEPPDWYSGTGAFTTVAMWSTMNSTLNSAANAMTSAPVQSSSSGGGGVSGGGSGGGGGGSW